MSEKKQSSVEWLVDQIEKDTNVRLRGLDLNNLLEQAKEMHQKEIMDAYVYGAAYQIDIKNGISPASYYKEKFNK